jgi:peptidoglycan lytic transglycosylase G
MIDELDLAFEERPEPEHWRHARRRRRGAQRGRPGKKGRGGGRVRTPVAFLLSFLLLAVLGGGAWYGYDRVRGFFNAPDYASAGTGQVRVEIKNGDTITDMGNTLYRADVVKSAKAFVEAAGKNPRSQNIQPGFYTLRSKMRASDAVDLLLDVKNKVVTKVTIPEGRTAKQTFDLLAKATGIPVTDFANAAKDPAKLGVPDFWFVRSDKKKQTKSIEGFLFPSTYDVNPDATAEGILKQMVAQFLQVATDIKFVETVQAKRGGISPYDALMVASLAQAEAGVPKDLGKIARVAYNRLYVDSPELGSHRLEMDVTTNYGLELAGKATKSSKNLTQSELFDPKNAYNTRVYDGLPPTAIDNPGQAALQAAMDPPKGGWYFFVAIDKQGNSAFATTKAQHDQNVQKARENGVL